MLKTTSFETSRDDLAPQPIDPTWIREGAPVARAITLTESADGLLTTGLWDCTSGTFTWIFGSDEIVHILEGEVRVRDRDGGEERLLSVGSVAYFPAGLETIWVVPKYVKKSFILRAPYRSRLRRAASFVKARAQAMIKR